MLQPQVARSIDEDRFGMLIFTWRGTVKRTKILAHLPGWSKDVFYRLEKGEIAPAFDQLRPLYRALWLAGASIPPDGPQVFSKFAREKIESKRTHLDRRSDEEWAELIDDLLSLDHEFRSRSHPSSLTSLNPLLVDTSHLVRRDAWHEQIGDDARVHAAGADADDVRIADGFQSGFVRRHVRRVEIDLSDLLAGFHDCGFAAERCAAPNRRRVAMRRAHGQAQAGDGR